MWFTHLTNPQPEALNVMHAERLRGALDPEALASAFEAVVQTHEVLRMRVALVGDQPVAVPCASITALQTETATHIAPSDRTADATRRVNAARARRFDLSAEAPFRAKLVRFDTDDHLLIMTLHHIACDEVSVRLLRRALLVPQERTAPGRGQMPAQYADIAEWQRLEEEKGAWKPVLARWAQRLRGAGTADSIAPTRLPGAGPGDAAVVEMLLPTGEVAILDAAAKRQNATSFTAMLSTALVLLHAASTRTDLTIATQLSGRARPEAAQLIGLFTSTAPLRNVLDPNEAFTDLMHRVQAQMWDLLAHQNVRFEAVLQHMGLERHAGRAPFCRIMFTHRKSVGQAHALGMLAAEEVPATDRSKAKFDIWISLVDSDQGRRLRLVYDTALYSEHSMQELASGFERVLRTASAAPDAPLSALIAPLELGLEPTPKAPEPQRVSHAPSSERPGARSHGANAPTSETLDRVGEIWRAVLGSLPDKPDTSFFDAGGDSLLLLRLVYLLEDATGVVLPLADAFHAPTPAAMALRIDRLRAMTHPLRAATSDALLEPFRTAAPVPDTGAPQAQPATSPRYFYVAGGGGHVAPFTSIARRIETAWEGIGIIDPALLGDEPPVERIEDLATRMVRAVLSADPVGPHVLVGYSAGGRAVYEMARQLRQMGLLAGCVVLDAGAGRVSGLSVALRPLRYLKHALRRAYRQASDGWAARFGGQMDPIEQARRKYKRVSLFQHARILRHRNVASDVPVVLLRATDSLRTRREADYGWSHMADLIAVIDTPGDHFNLYNPPRETVFAERFQQALERLHARLQAELPGRARET